MTYSESEKSIFKTKAGIYKRTDNPKQGPSKQA